MSPSEDWKVLFKNFIQEISFLHVNWLEEVTVNNIHTVPQEISVPLA